MLGLWSLGTAPLGLTLHFAFDVALDGLLHASEQRVLADLPLDSYRMSQLLFSTLFIRFCCFLHLFYLIKLIDLDSPRLWKQMFSYPWPFRLCIGSRKHDVSSMFAFENRLNWNENSPRYFVNKIPNWSPVRTRTRTNSIHPYSNKPIQWLIYSIDISINISRDFNTLKSKASIVWAKMFVSAASVYFRNPDGHMLEYLTTLDKEPRPDLGIISWSEGRRGMFKRGKQTILFVEYTDIPRY